MKTTIQWMYDGHRAAMRQAVMQTPAVNQAGNLNREYASALYLLTGMEDIWPWLQLYVHSDGIDHEGMLNHEPLSSGERLIVGLAGNLFNGGNYLKFSPVDLIDTLDDAMMDLALNGIALRRGHPTMAILKEEKVLV